MSGEHWDSILNATDISDITSDEVCKSLSWNSCSVGELLGFPDKPSKEIGLAVLEVSKELYGLGSDFSVALDDDNDLERAQAIHDKIHSGRFDHARAAILAKL